jgi:hypothetical protein
LHTQRLNLVAARINAARAVTKAIFEIVFRRLLPRPGYQQAIWAGQMAKRIPRDWQRLYAHPRTVDATLQSSARA